MGCAIPRRVGAVINRQGKLMTFRHVTKLGSAMNPAEADISVFTSTSAGAGSITLAVAGLGSWHLVAGDKFTIAGNPTVYTVTAGVVAASGKFDNVAFSPALSANASAGAGVSWTWANDYPVKAMVSSYDAKLIDGSTISIRDQRVTVVPSATDGRVLPIPTNADKLNLGTGTGFRAIGIVQPQYVGEAIAAYEIQAKG